MEFIKERFNLLIKWMLSKWIWVGIFLIIFLVFAGIWIGRYGVGYDAGYISGAGNGSDYKKQYYELNEKYEKAVTSINRLTQENASLKGASKGGLASEEVAEGLKVRKINTERQEKAAAEDFKKVNQQRDKILDNSIEMGRKLGRAEKSEEQSIELKNERDLSISVNVFLGVILLLYILYAEYRILSSNGGRILDGPSEAILEDNLQQLSPQKSIAALPPEKQSKEEGVS